MPRIEAASWVSQGLIASSRALLEFCPAASPRVRQSRLRRAPARPNAHSRPPRSAVSSPGRAVTARTETARGSESSTDARSVLGRGVAVVIVIVLSCRVGHLVAGHLLFAWPAISTLADTREAAVQRMWRPDGDGPGPPPDAIPAAAQAAPSRSPGVAEAPSAGSASMRA